MLMYQIKVSIFHDICRIMLDVYSNKTRIDNSFGPNHGGGGGSSSNGGSGWFFGHNHQHKICTMAARKPIPIPVWNPSPTEYGTGRVASLVTWRIRKIAPFTLSKSILNCLISGSSRYRSSVCCTT